ncbi:lysylphosphatidylglycerol synthase transmembrane domain-containing protein [Vagococcus fluvialis]|uniref:lysylphosphatidylglycerol synthase transmembrane domain-containing protein n=1 Tax=Vagococcus fluvialis TaxID=2738 RepID=UPI003B228F2A
MNKKNSFYLILVFVLGFLVIWNELRQVNLQDFLLEVADVNWLWIGVAVLLMLIHWGVEGKITQMFLRKTNPDYSLKNSYRIPLIQHLFNAITPFSTGGQPAQIVAMGTSGVDYGVAASVSLMKFVVYQVWVVLNFIVCLLFGFHWVSSNFNKLSYLIILGFVVHFVVVFCLLLIMFWHSLAKQIVLGFFNIMSKFKLGRRLAKFKEPVMEKLESFYEQSRVMKSSPKLMIKTSLMTILQLMIYYVVPYFVLLALHIEDVNVFKVIVFHAFIIMIISLFPIPGGTGGAEYSFSLLFGTFVVVPGKLVLAIFLWRIVTYYLGIVLGLFALMIKPDKKLRL